MTTGLAYRQYRRLRAPQANGGAVVDPPFDEVSALVAENRSLRAECKYDLQGRWLSEVSKQARGELIADARRWTSGYRDVDWTVGDQADKVFLAGHQPQLFHPGVWLKNFALGTLATQQGAVAINLLIDTDTLKQNTVAVPGGSVSRPEVAAIPMDRHSDPVPFEERRIVDRELFTQFGRRVADQITPLVPDPLIGQYWPLAIQRLEQTDNLGACLAQSRHRLEGRWGLTTLEVPESVVCQSEPFGWFIAHLLAQLPRFQSTYNEVVKAYRRAYRIRSAAHPVPDLASDGQWLEAPFWIWTADNPVRRRLFARGRHDEILLSNRRELEFSLPLSPDADADRAVQRLAELAEQGVRIRGRALATTLWARLVLGDLFVHGIGGAKYDQVTDVLIERFFGLRPPCFLVVSATLHLPVDHLSTTKEDARAIEHRLRELTYHPECHIDEATPVPGRSQSALTELLAAKERWTSTRQTASDARSRFHQIRRINQALQPWVAPQRDRLLAERASITEQLAAESILSCRDYAFCLFPKKTLQDFLFGLLPKKS